MSLLHVITLAFVRLFCLDLGPPSQSTEPLLAVVDQINGAWVHLSCEGGLELTLPLSLSERPLTEGQWVVYVPYKARLEGLNDTQLSRRVHALERDLAERLERLMRRGREAPWP